MNETLLYVATNLIVKNFDVLYLTYDLGSPSIPKNPRDKEANPRDAKRAALSSITLPLCIPPYILITDRKGPSPGGINSVPRILPS